MRNLAGPSRTMCTGIIGTSKRSANCAGAVIASRPGPRTKRQRMTAYEPGSRMSATSRARRQSGSEKLRSVSLSGELGTQGRCTKFRRGRNEYAHRK